ncbi:MAG: NFACT RNA binding domain-containing protein, partial [Oceanidesulfovibrio sp.]
MDSHFFRCLARRLGPLCRGARLDTIFAPLPDVTTVTLGHPDIRDRKHLILRADRQAPSLALSADKPPNPKNAPARAMWLRKRLRGRRLLEPYWDWPGRRLAWRLSPLAAGQEDEESAGGLDFLLIDLREGCGVVGSLPEPSRPGAAWETVDAEAAWEPDLFAVLNDPAAGLAEEGFTPALRRELARRLAHSQESAKALLESLAVPQCGAFRICGGEVLVWEPYGTGDKAQESQEPLFDDPLDAAARLAALRLGPHLERVAGRDEAKAQKWQRKKFVRARKAMAAEEERLESMRGQRGIAELLKSKMHELPTREKLAEVTLEGPDGPVTIPLDPSRTVAENVDRLFKRAAKGDRGVSMLASRREELERQESDFAAGRIPEQGGAKRKDGPARHGCGPVQGVARFRTDDGFLVLRGKNARANHALATKHSSPFDYWFHAEDGPGAHVVLKRDHAAQDVPDSSLEQAAMLAGLKSWQAESDKARVMCALCKHVSPIKGGKPGQVTVERVEASFLVALDRGL